MFEMNVSFSYTGSSCSSVTGVTMKSCLTIPPGTNVTAPIVTSAVLPMDAQDETLTDTPELSAQNSARPCSTLSEYTPARPVLRVPGPIFRTVRELPSPWSTTFPESSMSLDSAHAVSVASGTVTTMRSFPDGNVREANPTSSSVSR